MNLPKPSRLSLRGTSEEKIDYLMKYLQRLVAELERNYSAVNSIETISNGSPINNISVINNGIVIMREDGSQQTIESGKVLWSGAYYMNSNHTIELTDRISNQLFGILLVFSAYDNGPQEYHFQEFLIHKYSVGSFRNFPLIAPDFSFIGNKNLYINAKSITGDGVNELAGIKNGISFINHHWVLRAVIGV